MEKEFKNGLVLGKMMPMTMGHKHLIDTAIEQCETVHVMVCSLKSEPIPGYKRYAWVKQTYMDNPNVDVIWCRDENPQKPEDCPSVDDFYLNYWNPSVYNRIEKLDAVFTSEDYGDEFASYLGVKHVLVDIDRTSVPVSGTLVRNNPYGEMWNYVPDIVKPYFKKKVVVMGPESTGKSTMTKMLAKYFGVKYVEEYGRTYTDNIPAKEMTIKDYENIAAGHNLLIHNHIYDPDKVLFVDTDALTTKLFGKLYMGEFESPFIDKIISNQHFDLYLLLNIDVPWVDDGTRDFPHKRQEHFDMIKRELTELGLPFVVICGESYVDRFNSAVSEVNKLLKVK